MKHLLVSVVAMLFCGGAWAECSFDIEVGDALQFSVAEMEVAADCGEITINLSHTGKLPAAAMGHNWVLTTSGDMQEVAKAGMGAGLAANYVPADDARVLAATNIVGGGEKTSITFSLDGLSKDTDYMFFCSFPGHWGIMKGPFKIV